MVHAISRPAARRATGHAAAGAPRISTSTGLAGDLALGRQILTMIDASPTQALKSDSSTLASWRQAKRATVKGVVSGAGVGDAPVVVGGESPVVGRGSVAAGAVPAVASGGSVSNSVVPAAHSRVPVVSNVETPVVDHVRTDVPQGSMAT